MSEHSAQPRRLEAGTALFAATEDGAIVVVGLCDGVPPTVDVLPNGEPRLKWQAAAVSWPLARPLTGAHAAFAAVFPLPAREHRALRSVSLLLREGPLGLALHRAPEGLDAIFRTIAEEAGAAFPTVADGLVEALLGETAGPARVRAAAALVRLAARRTGFIEVSGTASDDELFMQGWASDLPAGRIRVLAASEPPLLTEFFSASYDRDDLSGRGKGFAGILQPAPSGEATALTQILFRGDDGWRAVDVYDKRKLIAAGDIPAHLRSLLPRATGPEDVLARLRRTAHRFDGRETVSQLQEPVRLGIDLAVRIPGGGMLIVGWLLDPKDSVRAVRLRVGTEAVVISDGWTRLARADVAGAYANDPLFRNLPANPKPAGFLAFGRLVENDAAPAHLEVDLSDARPPTFFPLTVSEAPPRAALAKLLQSVDVRSGVADAIVERQFGPMLRSLARVRAKAAEIVDTGDFDDAAPVALIIGADERVGDALSLLAVLAADPSTRPLPIILAAPADALSAVTGDLRRLAAFYGLSIRLVPTEPADDIFDGYVAGVAATRANTLALLSADLLPGTAGWLQRLLQTYRLRGEQHLVCPTVLFEDGSVRWAGMWLDERGGKRALAGRHVGLPKGVLAGAALEEVSAGTLDCCVLPRAAFESADGVSSAYLGTAAKNLDMALRIRLSGTAALWLPDVEMIAAEDTASAAGIALTRRVDRWSFDHRWSLALDNLRR